MMPEGKKDKEENNNSHDDLFEKYKQIQVHEHHFNNIELEIRKLASVWLLAALGAIAFIVRGADKSGTGQSSLMISSESLITIICCMANLGLFILWQLDQMVYHRLLNAVFLMGLRMEYLYKDILPIRTLMILYTQKRGVSRYQRWYYLIPMLLFALIAVIFSVSILVYSKSGSGFDKNGLPVIISLVSVATLLIAYLQSINKEKYSELAKEFNDQDFVNYLKKEKYKTVLSMH